MTAEDAYFSGQAVNFNTPQEFKNLFINKIWAKGENNEIFRTYFSGLKQAELFILNFWKKFLDDSTITLIDAKTQLQEYSLKKYKELPKYTFYKKYSSSFQKN